MKKLMITTIMTAVVGSTLLAGENNGIVYQVKCNMRSTKAKSTTPKSITHTVNFGMNAKSNGTFWYMDDAIVQNADNPNNGDVGSYSNMIAYVDGFKSSRAILHQHSIIYPQKTSLKL